MILLDLGMMVIAVIPLRGLLFRFSFLHSFSSDRSSVCFTGKLTHEFSVMDTILGAYGELGWDRYTPLIDDEELPCSREVQLAPCSLFLWVVD